MQKIKFIILALIFSICSSMARPMDSSFFKTWEEKELNLECDSGDGKYSACTRLVEILSKKCDEGDYESCGSLGAVLLVTMGRYKDSVSALKKACEADMMNYCFLLAGNEIFYGGNIHRAIGYFYKVCYGKKQRQEGFFLQDKGAIRNLPNR